MSSHEASRVNFNLTLADVLATVQTADLPERQRQERVSALRTFARARGKPLERLPAEPRPLAAELREVSSIAAGISRGRWANVRSHILKSVAMVHPISPGRHITPLSPGWNAPWKQLPLQVKMALSRFARFCTVREIEPTAVTEATFEVFRVHLNDSLLKDPDRIFAALVRGWRAARKAAPDWPQIDITLPNRRRDWTLPWSQFPESLQQECQTWCDRLAGRDLLADEHVKVVKPGTVAHRERQIRTFASALVKQGRDPATLNSVSDLVEIDAIKQGLRHLIERSGGQTTTAIYDFASALKAVARYHLRVNQAQLDQMTKIMQKLDPGKRGLTKTNRSRLRQLDDSTNKAGLLGLPSRLINLAARNPRSYAGALQAQAAVAIEILLMAPLRIGNLAQLDLEQHLVRPGRGNALHLVIEPEDVKNDEPLEYPLPPESVALIERYLQEFRPRLAALHCTALFPGRNGGGKSVNALRDLITRTVHRYTGMRMHPHLFRHAGAKLFLDINPGQYEVVRRVLAHKAISTTTKFYCGLEIASAVRHFDETILRQRRAPAK